MKVGIYRAASPWVVAIAVAELVASVPVALAGASPAAKCQAGKSKAGGKYASCLLGAEAKLLQTEGACSIATSTLCYLNGDCPSGQTCTKDLGKYNDAVTKCGEKIDGNYDKLEAKTSDAGDVCPTLNDAGVIQSLVTHCVDEINGTLEDGSLPSGTSGFPATEQTLCYDAAGVVASCAGSGQDGESQAGLARSYTDNGNGTITDHATGLMWEKLDDNNANGIHDHSRVYTWENAFQKIRVLNGDATACISAETPDVCCTGTGIGSCSPFAGHTDWRLPNAMELFSLVSFATYDPAVNPVFNTACSSGCTTASCSCTATSADFWSSTTRLDDTTRATYVQFYNGLTAGTLKAVSSYVRAVRGGD